MFGPSVPQDMHTRGSLQAACVGHSMIGGQVHTVADEVNHELNHNWGGGGGGGW